MKFIISEQTETAFTCKLTWNRIFELVFKIGINNVSFFLSIVNLIFSSSLQTSTQRIVQILSGLRGNSLLALSLQLQFCLKYLNSWCAPFYELGTIVDFITVSVMNQVVPDSSDVFSIYRQLFCSWSFEASSVLTISHFFAKTVACCLKPGFQKIFHFFTCPSG